MAAKNSKAGSITKKPISHRRVFTVMVSLLSSLTLSAITLSLMQNQPLTSASVSPMLMQADTSTQSIAELINPTVPLHRSQWNYIILYQSGRSFGNLAGMTSGRQVGGVIGSMMAQRAGVNFHFVVDNADNPKGYPSGHIEVGSSWRAQQPAAPYCTWPYFYHSAPNPYQNAIGVCLIGNLNRRQISDRQLEATVALIKGLQRKLAIPNRRVLCEWQLRKNVRPTLNEYRLTKRLDSLLAR
jgi:hypothetical protein